MLKPRILQDKAILNETIDRSTETEDANTTILFLFFTCLFLILCCIVLLSFACFYRIQLTQKLNTNKKDYSNNNENSLNDIYIHKKDSIPIEYKISNVNTIENNNNLDNNYSLNNLNSNYYQNKHVPSNEGNIQINHNKNPNQFYTLESEDNHSHLGIQQNKFSTFNVENNSNLSNQNKFVTAHSEDNIHIHINNKNSISSNKNIFDEYSNFSIHSNYHHSSYKSNKSNKKHNRHYSYHKNKPYKSYRRRELGERKNSFSSTIGSVKSMIKKHYTNHSKSQSNIKVIFYFY